MEDPGMMGNPVWRSRTIGWSMAPTELPAPTWSGVRVNRYRILVVMRGWEWKCGRLNSASIFRQLCGCPRTSAAGSFDRSPSATDTEPESLFAEEGAAPVLDDRSARVGAVPI